MSYRSQSDLEARGYLDASRDQNDPYLEGDTMSRECGIMYCSSHGLP